MNQSDKIHQIVQEHYGAIARQASPTQSASCCSPSDVINPSDIGVSSDMSCCGTPDHANSLYGENMASQLPFDVTGLSLGCGDPVTIAELNQGETVIDLGSGGGIDCFFAARQVGPTGKVIGVDMTPDMLTKANANKAQLGYENVEFREGHIEALPVDDNTVDVVMSNCVINLSPDKAQVFREAFRVLKTGGRIAVSDIVTHGNFSAEMREDASQWAGCIAGAIDVNDYIQQMQDAGFIDIQVVDKQSAEDYMSKLDGEQPTIFSARFTATKP